MAPLAPRTILYTGKGGVGKTSVAVATARRCAALDLRTILLSTDPAHSLSDALEIEVGSTPVRCGDNLDVQEVGAQDEMERNWDAVQAWMGNLLIERGVDPISAEELTVPPGVDELFSLLQIKHHHESGDYDAIVVDCAPTGETLRLLSFPDVAQWWLDKVFPADGRLVAAARPLAGLLDVPLPSEEVIGDVRRLVESLVALNRILRDRSATSLRLVMTPDRMVVREAMRTFTYLNLYGFLTDAIVVNRVLPDEVAGGYFERWLAAQAEQLELVRSAFAPVPILTAPYFEREVIGVEMIDRLGAALFEDTDAHAVLHETLSQELTSENGTATLRLAIPFIDKADIKLRKIGLEVVVRVGPQKRTIMLPSAMSAYRPRTASFEAGALEVRFEREDETAEVRA